MPVAERVPTISVLAGEVTAAISACFGVGSGRVLCAKKTYLPLRIIFRVKSVLLCVFLTAF